jgi:ABC-2 type transport system permease protein
MNLGMMFAPASLPGLVLHNMRVGWRLGAKGGLRRKIVVGVLLACFMLACVGLAVMLRDVPIGPTPAGLTAMTLAALVMSSFGLSQALSRAEQTLYGSGDLDLLLSAPIATRTVLWSKLVGIAATVLMSEGLFVLPPLLPVIVLGHPGLAGALVLLVALVLATTCLGLGVLLTIVRLAGPRAARTVAQVTIALLGGAMVLASQVMRYGGQGGGRNGFGVVFGWARAHHLGQAGWSSLPGRAGFGDPLAGVVLVAAALALFGVTGWLFERHFAAALQQAGQHSAPLVQHRVARSGMRARFSASLVRTLAFKELALLLRNPQLLATMLLRLVYLVPMMVVLLHQQSQFVLLPAIMFVGVFVTTQLTGDLAWLIISGEDTPDLLMVAPVSRATMGRAKQIVAVLMAAPLLGLIVLGIATRATLLALVVIPIGLAGSATAAAIQLRLERPSPRKAFGRRAQGASIVANLLVLLVALTLGGTAAGLAWWITR